MFETNYYHFLLLEIEKSLIRKKSHRHIKTTKWLGVYGQQSFNVKTFNQIKNEIVNLNSTNEIL